MTGTNSLMIIKYFLLHHIDFFAISSLHPDDGVTQNSKNEQHISKNHLHYLYNKTAERILAN